jgi:hypothetical protein
MVAYAGKEEKVAEGHHVRNWYGRPGRVIPAGILFSTRPEGLEADVAVRADAFSEIISPAVATIAAFAAFLRRLLLDCFSISAFPFLSCVSLASVARPN